MESVAIVGKLPSRGDFLRLNLSSPELRRVDRWVEEAVGHLSTSGLAFPGSLRMLWSDPETHAWVLGAFRPSQDSVGRHFPLGALARHQDDGLSSAELVVASGAFFSGALDWLDAAERVGEAAMVEGLERMASTPIDVAGARNLCEAVAARETVQDVESRLFGGSLDQRYYAYRTFFFGLDAVSGGQRIVFDCPLAVDVDQFFWLAIATTLTSTRPTVLWVEEPAPRMLVSMGGPLPPSAVRALVGVAEDPTWYWPLVTSREVAHRQARESLDGVLPSVEGETIGAFLHRLRTVFEGGSHRA